MAAFPDHVDAGPDRLTKPTKTAVPPPRSQGDEDRDGKVGRQPAKSDQEDRTLVELIVTAVPLARLLLLVVGVALLLVVWWFRSSGGDEPQIVAETSRQGVDINRSADNEAERSAGKSPESSPAPAPQVVHVIGKVREPGLVQVPEGARVADAIAAAGGMRGRGTNPGVNLARTVVDGEQIVVGSDLSAAAGGAEQATSANSTVPSAAQPLDVNRASAEQLQELPGIGPVLAASIVDYRESNGPFMDVVQLAEVSGIGESTLNRLEPFVRVQ